MTDQLRSERPEPEPGQHQDLRAVKSWKPADWLRVAAAFLYAMKYACGAAAAAGAVTVRRTAPTRPKQNQALAADFIPRDPETKVRIYSDAGVTAGGTEPTT